MSRTDRLVIAPGASGRFAIPILFGIGVKIAIDAGRRLDLLRLDLRHVDALARNRPAFARVIDHRAVA